MAVDVDDDVVEVAFDAEPVDFAPVELGLEVEALEEAALVSPFVAGGFVVCEVAVFETVELALGEVLVVEVEVEVDVAGFAFVELALGLAAELVEVLCVAGLVLRADVVDGVVLAAVVLGALVVVFRGRVVVEVEVVRGRVVVCLGGATGSGAAAKPCEGW